MVNNAIDDKGNLNTHRLLQFSSTRLKKHNQTVLEHHVTLTNQTGASPPCCLGQCHYVSLAREVGVPTPFIRKCHYVYLAQEVPPSWLRLCHYALLWPPRSANLMPSMNVNFGSNIYDTIIITIDHHPTCSHVGSLLPVLQNVFV